MGKGPRTVNIPPYFFENELVPEFELVPEEEVAKILKKYHCTLEQLPRIHVTDPVVVFLKAKPGQVIKFIRKSEVAGESIYYRVVSEV